MDSTQDRAAWGDEGRESIFNDLGQSSLGSSVVKTIRRLSAGFFSGEAAAEEPPFKRPRIAADGDSGGSTHSAAAAGAAPAGARRGSPFSFRFGGSPGRGTGALYGGSPPLGNEAGFGGIAAIPPAGDAEGEAQEAWQPVREALARQLVFEDEEPGQQRERADPAALRDEAAVARRIPQSLGGTRKRSGGLFIVVSVCVFQISMAFHSLFTISQNLGTTSLGSFLVPTSSVTASARKKREVKPPGASQDLSETSSRSDYKAFSLR